MIPARHTGSNLKTRQFFRPHPQGLRRALRLSTGSKQRETALRKDRRQASGDHEGIARLKPTDRREPDGTAEEPESPSDERWEDMKTFTVFLLLAPLGLVLWIALIWLILRLF